MDRRTKDFAGCRQSTIRIHRKSHVTPPAMLRAISCRRGRDGPVGRKFLSPGGQRMQFVHCGSTGWEDNKLKGSCDGAESEVMKEKIQEEATYHISYRPMLLRSVIPCCNSLCDIEENPRNQ
eukprot:TRINITY_DN1727_c0_g1_i1.p2 TRINITY_DN1727_c0_g1~~TRINITY_DN1727_c0_g1_i1.p2  ORF type:complete len:122 (-),score=6.64 TRINITY_DN1727_c0_g1_i1:213-578(-)